MTDSPTLESEEAFASWRDTRAHWAGTVRRIAESNDLPAHNIIPFTGGTNLVVELDGAAVLKIFPPIYRDQYASERIALRQLSGRLSVSIPEILAAGEQEGWSWLLLTRLSGVIGSAIWPGLQPGEKETILRDIGRTIAEVQAVPAGACEALRTGWPDFIREQAAGCLERHRSQGFPRRFLSELGELAAGATGTIPLHGKNVILTGDWIPQNFFLSQRSGQWRLSGLIDFGDVRTGWGEYDLLAPSAFMCEGKAELVRGLFDGYGVDATTGGATLRRRLLTLMALHQESDFRNLNLPGWESRISTLSDLGNLIWPDLEDCNDRRE